MSRSSGSSGESKSNNTVDDISNVIDKLESWCAQFYNKGPTEERLHEFIRITTTLARYTSGKVFAILNERYVTSKDTKLLDIIKLLQTFVDPRKDRSTLTKSLEATLLRCHSNYLINNGYPVGSGELARLKKISTKKVFNDFLVRKQQLARDERNNKAVRSLLEFNLAENTRKTNTPIRLNFFSQTPKLSDQLQTNICQQIEVITTMMKLGECTVSEAYLSVDSLLETLLNSAPKINQANFPRLSHCLFLLELCENDPRGLSPSGGINLDSQAIIHKGECAKRLSDLVSKNETSLGAMRRSANKYLKEKTADVLLHNNNFFSAPFSHLGPYFQDFAKNIDHHDRFRLFNEKMKALLTTDFVSGKSSRFSEYARLLSNMPKGNLDYELWESVSYVASMPSLLKQSELEVANVSKSGLRGNGGNSRKILIDRHIDPIFYTDLQYLLSNEFAFKNDIEYWSELWEKSVPMTCLRALSQAQSQEDIASIRREYSGYPVCGDKDLINSCLNELRENLPGQMLFELKTHWIGQNKVSNLSDEKAIFREYESRFNVLGLSDKFTEISLKYKFTEISLKYKFTEISFKYHYEYCCRKNVSLVDNERLMILNDAISSFISTPGDPKKTLYVQKDLERMLQAAIDDQRLKKDTIFTYKLIFDNVDYSSCFKKMLKADIKNESGITNRDKVVASLVRNDLKSLMSKRAKDIPVDRREAMLIVLHGASEELLLASIRGNLHEVEGKNDDNANESKQLNELYEYLGVSSVNSSLVMAEVLFDDLISDPELGSHQTPSI